MTIAENVGARVAYKPYSTGVITSNAQAISSSDPGASGGQILRRTTSSLALTKDTYQSAEVRSDRQTGDFRHGVKRVTGSISGELSPGTYFDFLEAACRGTKSTALALSNTQLTSVTADNSTKKFTFGSDPVAQGMLVGQVLRFTNLLEPLNNSKNFLITGFGGASNTDVFVYPAPTTMASDSAFNVVTNGKRVSIPATGHVARKFAVEVYHSDLDLHRLFTECRVGGINLNLPSTGMSTIEIPMMGRDQETGTGASSPFFTAPTAATTTGILAAVNGLLRVGGTNQGVITGAQVNLNLNPSSEAVVGQNFVPEIFLGRAQVSGQFNAFLEDLTLTNYFVNETEVEVLLYLLASSADASSYMTVYMPRVKLGSAQIGLEGEAGVPVTFSFQAIRYQGVGPGIDTTTIAFCDSDAT